MKSKFTPKQSRALPMLAAGLSGAATALAVGCQESTVSYWLNHCPDFIAELERLRLHTSQQAMDRLQASFAMAVDELQNMLKTSKTDAVRLKAAMFIIEGMAPKLVATSPRAIDPESVVELNQLHEVFKQLGLTHATA